MKKDISYSDFEREFREYGRENQFSYHGLRALYDYLIDYEDSCDIQIDLDVIALCCDYTEFDSLQDIIDNYPSIRSLKDLYDHTQVIEFRDGIIIQDF